MPDGLRFYWDYDRESLQKNPHIWVDWLMERFQQHALRGLEQMLGRMEGREGGWALLFAQGLFGAVEGLSSFAFRMGDNHKEFTEFCRNYYLPDPCPWPSLADAMYGKFRCGLAHGFSIEKGGLTFKEEIGSAEPVTLIDGCFWLDPRWLLDRQRISLETSLTRAAVAGSQEEKDFRARFQEILGQTCAQPPPKQI